MTRTAAFGTPSPATSVRDALGCAWLGNPDRAGKLGYRTRRTLRRRKSIMMYWPSVTVDVK
jgi:hypothetical protein